MEAFVLKFETAILAIKSHPNKDQVVHQNSREIDDSGGCSKVSRKGVQHNVALVAANRPYRYAPFRL